MKTIELIKKLAELARLVEIWENPYHVTSYPFHYEDYTAEEFAALPECDKYYIKMDDNGHLSQVPKQKYVKDIPVEYTEMQNERGEVLTTEAFKAEVRKVAEALIDEFDFVERKNLKTLREVRCYADIDTFNDLFGRLVFSPFKKDKAYALQAICYKMGVELESEEK